jgi:hypothetical protein
MMTSQQQEFDPSRYPNLKPTKPRNKSLRTCAVCKKPGYMYLLSGETPDSITIYYAHYNEPPIGITMLKGKPIGFRYRRCNRDGKTYNSLEEAIEADQKIQKPVDQKIQKPVDQKQVFIPKGKVLTVCTKCNKPGYKYRTYFQHYNEPPVGKILLRGEIIGDKFRKCYLAKEKINQGQVLQDPKTLERERERFPKPAHLKSMNIECPRCHRNGVLNVAIWNPEQAKTTFYVRHEKLGGAPWGRGKNKVDRIKRCYIGRQNVQNTKSLGGYQKESTVAKSKLKRNGLDRYIEPEFKLKPVFTRKIRRSISNPNRNVVCCICKEIGVLRPRIDKGRLMYYFAHGQIQSKEMRHHISLSNIDQMAYCKEQDKRNQENLMLKNS